MPFLNTLILIALKTPPSFAPHGRVGDPRPYMAGGAPARAGRSRLHAQGLLDCSCDAPGQRFHLFFRLGFYHHSRQGFGA